VKAVVALRVSWSANGDGSFDANASMRAVIEDSCAETGLTLASSLTITI
jgi:hypothetical protein